MSAAPDSHEEGEASSERWLVSYADFITLMFAFFTVLYATSQKDVEKSKQFEDSIKKFLIKAGGQGGSGSPQAQINIAEKQNSPIEQPIETFHPSKIEAATGLDEAETYIEAKISAAERKQYILDLASDEWGVRITLRSSAIFSADSEKFRPEAVAFISKLSGLLALTKRKVLIEGHTAPGEIGSYHSGWDFASARAVNMLRFMQKKENLSPGRLAAASFADSRPIFEGDKAALNSRLEVVLLNSDMDM
jgi:chemotaxis protein MotB